jgi:peptide deformylase
MAVRKILKWPSAKLRLKSKEVSNFEEAGSLAVDIRDTMRANLGVGVAAPQIGFNLKILVVDAKHLPSIEPSKTVTDTCVLINPEVIPLTEETFSWEEACLSVDDVQSEVKRFSSISLQYQDLEQVSHSVELHGEESGVVQHEADHLDGRIFIDRLPMFERRRVIKKLRRKNADKNSERKKKNKKKLAEIKRQNSRKDRKKTKKTFGKNKRNKK